MSFFFNYFIIILWCAFQFQSNTHSVVSHTHTHSIQESRFEQKQLNEMKAVFQIDLNTCTAYILLARVLYTGERRL